MWRFIFLLLILVGSVWLGLFIAKDPGMAFFSFRQSSVEMPLWFAVLSLLGLIFILYTILRLFDRVDNVFYRLKNWLKWRRKNQAFSKTNHGLIELIEHRWKQAEYNLKDGLAESDAPLINYLALAKAAHEQDDFLKRDAYLRSAAAAAPQAEVAIGITQAELQLDQGKLEEALATLNHLRLVAPRHPLVLKLLERIYIHQGDWKQVLALLPNLYKAKVLTRENYNLLTKKTYEELLLSAHTVENLQLVWQGIPAKFKKESDVIFSYAKQYSLYPNSAEELEPLVFKSLKKTWNKELAMLYGALHVDPKKQLSHAETLLKLYPNQASLLLTAGRLSMRCQLWGKARHYFEESLHLEQNPETYILYGKLLEQLGDSTLAMQQYHDGLLWFASEMQHNPFLNKT